MNILIITPIYEPVLGGASIYFRLLLNILKNYKMAEKVIILTRPTNEAPIFEKNNKSLIIRLLPYPIESNKYIWYVTKKLSNIITFIIVIMVKVIYNIKLIHFHTITPVEGVVLVGKLFKMSLIADKHDLAKPSLSLKYVNKIISISQNIKIQLLDFGISPDKIENLPLPFDATKPLNMEELHVTLGKYNIDENVPYLCFAGDIVEYKGVFELLEAFTIILKYRPNFQLILVGKCRIQNNEKIYEFNQAIQDQRVKYLGQLEHKDTLAIIQGAQILVLPSKTEGMPRVCLEAMGLNKKVLCPGIVPEFQKYCPDFVLNYISPKSIAEKIDQILFSNKSMMFPLYLYSSDYWSKRILEIYESVCTD